MARNVGLAYFNTQAGNQAALGRSLLYDFVNPWAFIMELKSTHPLPGKRIRRLSRFSETPLFDFETLEQSILVDKRRLYGNFLRGVMVVYSPTAVVFAVPFLYFGLEATNSVPIPLDVVFGGWIALVDATVILRTLYAFPGTESEPTTVLELMGDLYASPVRGRSVELDGELVGRGVPGLIISEDLLIQDETGLMFLNYEGLIPLLGNLFFGLRRVPKLIGEPVTITGWFRRGSFQWIGLRQLHAVESDVTGFVKLGGLIGGGILTLFGVAIPMLL